MKKLVNFLRPWKVYSPGDMAGFDAEQADSLVKAKVAEHVEAESSEGEPKHAKAKK